MGEELARLHLGHLNTCVHPAPEHTSHVAPCQQWPVRREAGQQVGAHVPHTLLALLAPAREAAKCDSNKGPSGREESKGRVRRCRRETVSDGGGRQLAMVAEG